MKNKHSMQQSRASKNTKIVRRTINTIAPIWRKIMLISYLFLEAQSFSWASLSEQIASADK